MSLDHTTSTPARAIYDDVARRSAAVVIRAYSTSFAWACRLLAEPVRTHVQNVYALVRIADEVVDDPAAATEAVHRGHLLTVLEEETYQALRTGYSTNLVVHAFAGTARAWHDHGRRAGAVRRDRRSA